jgi:UDP-2-acetamido-2-deoxy-ribo-hexuluronate aminotransferase
MTIKFFNLTEQYLDNKDIIDSTVQDVFLKGQFYVNKYVDNLEAAISERYNGAHAQLCNNGTSALHAALLALDIPSNTNILMPALTYCATAQAAMAIGCNPVFVDIDQYWLMDPEHMEYQYERYNPSAVIAVDLYGQGMNLEWLIPWCRERKIKLIIDAAQSYMLCKPDYDQTQADAVTLSFNPLKNLGGSGHGGAIVSRTIDPVRLRAACHEGKIGPGPRGQVNYPGLNYRIDAVQAAVILAKVPYHDRMIGRKIEISNRYYAAFDQHRDKLDMHVRTPWSDCQYYVFTIAPTNHEAVKQALTANDIEHSSHYNTPLHKEIAFGLYDEYCPRASSLTGRVISLPNHWHLTDEQVDRVIQTVISAL